MSESTNEQNESFSDEVLRLEEAMGERAKTPSQLAELRVIAELADSVRNRERGKRIDLLNDAGVFALEVAQDISASFLAMLLTGAVSKARRERQVRPQAVLAEPSSSYEAPDRRPSEWELCAIADEKTRKRAALLYDRIYLGSGSHSGELDIPLEFTFGVRSADDIVRNHLIRHSPPFDLDNPARSRIGVHGMARSVIDGYASHGIAVVPVYSGAEEFVRDFPDGTSIACLAAFQNLPVVEESAMSWSQVSAFREDKDSIWKYRRLRRWLRDGLEAKSLGEAIDTIGARLEDYEEAIKKHGLASKTGFLTTVLDWKSLGATAGGLVSVEKIDSLAGHPWAAQLVAGVVLTSRITAYIADQKLKSRHITRKEFGEVALLHDAVKLLDGQKGSRA